MTHAAPTPATMEASVAHRMPLTMNVTVLLAMEGLPVISVRNYIFVKRGSNYDYDMVFLLLWIVVFSSIQVLKSLK